VTASAGNKVVYAGAGLRGYGSSHHQAQRRVSVAYAHNKSEKEGQQVTRSQKIAEMGNTDADQVKLHFEIRRQGKPVIPLRYHPPRELGASQGANSASGAAQARGVVQ
jgi:lipoprotein NlpD